MPIPRNVRRLTTRAPQPPVTQEPEVPQFRFTVRRTYIPNSFRFDLRDSGNITSVHEKFRRYNRAITVIATSEKEARERALSAIDPDPTISNYHNYEWGTYTPYGYFDLTVDPEIQEVLP